MKTIKFMFLFTILALLAGCSSFMPPTISDHGVQIRGKRTVVVKIHNNSGESILVELRTTSLDFRADYHLVKSKEVKTFQTKVDWEGTITIRHRDESAKDFLGDTLYEESFLTGLIEDQDIYIDNLSLRGKSRQRGFILNVGDPTIITLDDGRSYSMMTGQSIVLEKASGSYSFGVSPVRDPYNHYGTGKIHSTIDNRRREYEYYPPDGSPPQMLDFKIELNEHWRVNR